MALTWFGLPFLLLILIAVHGLRNLMPMDQYLTSHGYNQARLVRCYVSWWDRVGVLDIGPLTG